MMAACDICGAGGARIVVTVDEWRILRCPMCDVGWLDPRPDPSDSPRQYNEQYFADHRITTSETDEQLALKVAAQDSRVKFVRRFKEAGRLLDVGCASGYFLASARAAGFAVRGLEISDWAVQEGRERLGLEIKQGTIEPLQFPDAGFDVVTMWHVLEHIEEPVKSLVEVRGWLRPEGVLVLECPNTGSFDARRYGAAWDGWRIPYHVWHFTPRSLGRMLQQSGYDLLCAQTVRSQWVKEKLRRIPVLSVARNLVSAGFSGRDMRLVAKPVDRQARV